jgi:hypothetical protein
MAAAPEIGISLMKGYNYIQFVIRRNVLSRCTDIPSNCATLPILEQLNIMLCLYNTIAFLLSSDNLPCSEKYTHNFGLEILTATLHGSTSLG